MAKSDVSPVEVEAENIRQSDEYMAFMEKAKVTKAVNFKTHFPKAAAKIEKMAKDDRAVLSEAWKSAKAKPELLKSIVDK